MTRHDSESSDRIDASTSTSDRPVARGTATGALSRRRLLGAMGAGAAASLAGCSGILGGGGGGGGDGSGGGPDNVTNEVDGIEITDVSPQTGGGRYSIMVTLRNTGGEETGVLDFTYDVTLYDESGSEIQTMGSAAANRDGFYDGNPGKVEVIPQTDADPSTVDSFELVVRCDEGPYCE